MPAEPQQISGSAGSSSSSPGIAAQQLARGLADALGVGEVAGVVVGHLHGQRVALGARRLGREHLGHVADLLGEGQRAAVADQVAVLLHGRAAAGGVGHDEVVVVEGVDGLLGELAGLVVVALVVLQGAAAARGGGRVHLPALGREHAGGGGVDVAEEPALHAALEQGDAAARGARGRGHGRGRLARPARVQARRELAQRAHERHLAARGQPDGAGAAPEAGQRHERPQPLGVGEERVDAAAQQPLACASACRSPAPGPASW